MGRFVIKDSKGVHKTFHSSERSHGLVSKLPSSGNIYGRKDAPPKPEKPFVATVTPFEPDFVPPFKEAYIP